MAHANDLGRPGWCSRYSARAVYGQQYQTTTAGPKDVARATAYSDQLINPGKETLGSNDDQYIRDAAEDAGLAPTYPCQGPDVSSMLRLADHGNTGNNVAPRGWSERTARRGVQNIMKWLHIVVNMQARRLGKTLTPGAAQTALPVGPETAHVPAASAVMRGVLQDPALGAQRTPTPVTIVNGTPAAAAVQVAPEAATYEHRGR